MDRLERVPLVSGGLESGDDPSRVRRCTALGCATGVVALLALVALAVGADAAPGRLTARLGQAAGLGSVRAAATCEARVHEATKDSTFYAFDLFAFTPFNVKGEYTRDPPDANVLAAKTTPSQFMYPQWLRAPLRLDKRRVPTPDAADLLIMTDNLVDIAPFTAKFVWHTGHPEQLPGSWQRLDEWWRGVGGDAKGEAVVAAARERLGDLKKILEGHAAAGLGETQREGAASESTRPSSSTTHEETETALDSGDEASLSAIAEAAALESSKQSKKKLAFMLPSEWMFGKEDVPDALKLGAVIRDVFGTDAMTAVTDFDDGGPVVSSVVTTVPFTTHSALADELLATGGVVSYKNKKKQTFFKGTLARGAEGALGVQTMSRVALKKLEGHEAHDVFVSGDDKDGDLGTHPLSTSGSKTSYADGMRSSTFCWIPRGDNPTSRRIFDAIAAGCIPVVVSDDIASYLPFRWAVDWRSMILQVPEAVFAKNAIGTAAAVLALPDGVVDTLRSRADAARYKLLWNDRTAHDQICVEGKKTKCSQAPKLYLDEMLHRAKLGITDPGAPLCARQKNDDARFVDGGAWTAEGSCPPWLEMHGLCGDTAE